MKILNWNLFLERVGEIPIEDFQTYVEGMAKSVMDKAFFVNMIDFDAIVDFGCADGSLMDYLSKSPHKYKMIGYDLDEDMVSVASARLGDNATITSDWNEVISLIKDTNAPILNLSSVIHEVYSYSRPTAVRDFWGKVFSGNFKYITIRDMVPLASVSKIKGFEEDVEKVRANSDAKRLSEFEERYGNIGDDYRVFLHYLLKYRYGRNWRREVNENYFPLSVETLKGKIPRSWKIVFEESSLLPFLKNQVYQDFGIELSQATHLKMIIENKKFRK